MNVVVIKTDQQRFDTLSCMGHPIVRTPNLDRLAQEGSTFDNAFCVSPLCVPSRVSFFRGQYVHRTRCCSNGQHDHIGPSCGCLLDQLRQRGWVLGLAGKNHAFQDAYLQQHFSFREEYGHWGKTHGQITPQDRQVAEYLNREMRPGYGDKLIMEGLIEEPMPFEPALCPTWRIAQDGARFVEQNSRQPFFLYLSFPDPHFPNVLCQPYWSMYEPEALQLEAWPQDWTGHPFAHFVQSQASGFADYTPAQRRRLLATYLGQISFIDAAIGMFLHRLGELGLAQETTVVFTSDHGDFGGRYGLIGKTKAFYEPLLRIPLILRLPGEPAGKRYAAQVSNIDVMPTILEALGLAVPAQVQGRSLLPLLRGKATEHRREIFAEVGMPQLPPPPLPMRDYPAHNRQRWQQDGVFWFVDYTCNGRSAMIRTDGWKYCFYTGDGEELYDLGADPLERTNLAGHVQHAARQAKLKNRLLEWLLTAPIQPA